MEQETAVGEVLQRRVSCFQKAAVVQLGSTNHAEKNNYGLLHFYTHCNCSFE